MMNIQSIYKILSGLSKRERFIFYGAIFFISLTFLDRLAISPILSNMQEVNTEIKEKESGIGRNLHILAYKEKILKESRKYAHFFGVVESEDEEMASLLKEIESLANKASVYLVDIKPGGVEPEQEYYKYFVKLTCESQMEQLIDFMYFIESSDNLLFIDKYRISPKSRGSSVAVCSISVFKIAVP